MGTTSNWRVLQVQRQDIPRLLVKHDFHDDGYQINVTDLGRIWGESITKAECIQRAVDYGSSIDPSQDDEQLHILLEKIQGALNHENNTTLELHSKEADGHELSIEVTAVLPRPLAPLSWTIQLQILDPSQLEVELVSPLLRQAMNLQQQVEQLVSELQNKDRVISKICDRLETSGNDLTMVFPGVSNIKTKAKTKKSQRELLANHVKGLGDFDVDVWRSRSDTTVRQAAIADEDMDSILGRLSSAEIIMVKDSTKAWWTHLDVHSSTASGKSINLTNPSLDTPMLDRNESVQDDEFQKQATPPRLKPSANKAPEKLPLDMSEKDATGRAQTHEIEDHGMDGDDSSTEDDDDDLDAVPQHEATIMRSREPHAFVTSSSSSSSSSSTRESGKIAEQVRDEQPTPVPPPPKKLGAFGGRTAPPPRESPPVEELPPDRAPTNTKPRGRLGAIGGKAKINTPPVAASVISQTERTTPPPTKMQKMSVIGGNKALGNGDGPVAAVEEPSPNEVESPAPAHSAEQQRPSEPRETSQERADKKRDQLKRELDQKSKSTAKKKRKF